MKKILYIFDLKQKQKSSKDIHNIIRQINSDDQILSLTPYSHFIFEKEELNFKIFHDIVSIAEFRDKVINEYEKIDLLFRDYKDLEYLSRSFMQVLTYQMYIRFIESYINMHNEKYNVIYITDTSKQDITFKNIISNKTTLLHYSTSIKKIIYLRDIDNSFYKKYLWKKKIQLIIKYLKNIDILIKKIFKKNKYSLNYDNQYFINEFSEKKISIEKSINIEKYISQLKMKISTTFDKDIQTLFLDIMQDVINSLINYRADILSYKSFSYLSSDLMLFEALTLKENNIPIIFFQHGNYLYPHMFFNGGEIGLANTNFVINDYTNKIFKKYGSKNPKTVGSIYFNKYISKKETKFDYLYITYNTNYAGNICYIESDECLYSFDGYEIYQRHKSIIELFGTKYKSEKICIKMHPMILSFGNYVPIIELSKSYKNITIDFTTAMLELIEESEYIISDYFSSEFLNRDIHYKKNILLFQGAPIPLPNETIEDMKKMFILVETVEDLDNSINDIKKIVENRIRYDNIIEYYSSKNCDTKKIVKEILKKELNGI